MRAGRKYPAIDLLKLHADGGHRGWNALLERMYLTHDVEGLKKTLYGIQAGMDDLAKAKLATPKINEWFVRLQRSLELTAKKVFRAKYPSPCDDPAIANNFPEHLEAKRKRDQELERFLREASY